MTQLAMRWAASLFARCRRPFRVAFAVAFSTSAAVIPSIIALRPASAQQVWLGPIDSEGARLRGWPPNDFLQMFSSDAPWEQVSNHVRVFIVPTQFVLRAPDFELKRVAEGLKKRNIALAMAGLMLHGHDGCGGGVEGYTDISDILKAVRRLKAENVELYSIAMDGPFFSGHEYNGPRACHDSLQHIANEVAERVKDARSVFPAVRVGDIEPVGNTISRWPTDLAAWLESYRAATGTPLDFLQVDTNWSSPTWHQQLLDVASILKKAGVSLGIIYNGEDASTESDAAWTAAATTRFRLIEGEMHLAPDIVAFESWDAEPHRNLPEDDPMTLTAVVLAYETWKRLEAVAP